MNQLISDECLADLHSRLDLMTVPAQENPAVALCCDAAMMEYCQARKDGDSDQRARVKSGRGFRLALPPLIGEKNVCDFIACVTHGMLLGLIPSKDAGKLLYAAQVAQQACRAEAAIRRKGTGKPPEIADSAPQTGTCAPAESAPSPQNTDPAEGHDPLPLCSNCAGPINASGVSCLHQLSCAKNPPFGLFRRGSRPLHSPRRAAASTFV